MRHRRLCDVEPKPERQQNSFGRGLDVLIAIARSGQATVAEVAAELEIPQSTVYRYIRSLRDYALIEESGGSTCRVGACWIWGVNISPTPDWWRWAPPICRI